MAELDIALLLPLGSISAMKKIMGVGSGHQNDKAFERNFQFRTDPQSPCRNERHILLVQMFS
jgi:hypothetical protein